jgi:hypothetical protein
VGPIPPGGEAQIRGRAGVTGARQEGSGAETFLVDDPLTDQVLKELFRDDYYLISGSGGRSSPVFMALLDRSSESDFELNRSATLNHRVDLFLVYR